MPLTHPKIHYQDLNTVLKIKHPIQKLYHISDIHIFPKKRHDEYSQVFQRVYDTLKEMEPGLIVITGDIFDSKTNIKRVSDLIILDFFQNLSKLMPILCIAGNHDIDIKDSALIDNMTGCLLKVGANYKQVDRLGYISGDNCRIDNLVFVKKTGAYKIGEHVFGVTSFLDNGFIHSEHIRQSKCMKDVEFCKLIGVAHLALYGSEYFNGFYHTGETYTREMFNGYDCVLLGDIHKHHFSNTQKTIAYAGSLIQKNFGETVEGHGVLVWNLESNTAKLMEIPNSYAFINVRFEKDELVNSETVTKNMCDKTFIRLKISSCPKTDPKTVDNWICHTKKQIQVIQLIRQIDNRTNGNNNCENIDGGDVCDIKNLYNLDTQLTVLQELLTLRDIDPETQKLIVDIHKDYYKPICENGGSTFEWKLKTLKFENIMCYTGKNFVDFTKLGGLVGILGANSLGKSTILDIVLFTIYDKCSRVNIKNRLDMLTKGKNNGWIELVIQVGDEEIIMSIDMKIKKKKGVPVPDFTRNYYRIQKVRDEKEKCYELPRDEIRNIFGDYETFINVHVLLQNDNGDMGNAGDNYILLKKLMKLDCFDSVFPKLKDDISNSRVNKSVIDNLVPESDIISDQQKLEQLKNQLKVYQSESERFVEKRHEINDNFRNLCLQISQKKESIDDESTEINNTDVLSELQTREKHLIVNEAKLESQIKNLWESDSFSEKDILDEIFSHESKIADLEKELKENGDIVGYDSLIRKYQKNCSTLESEIRETEKQYAKYSANIGRLTFNDSCDECKNNQDLMSGDKNKCEKLFLELQSSQQSLSEKQNMLHKFTTLQIKQQEHVSLVSRVTKLKKVLDLSNQLELEKTDLQQVLSHIDEENIRIQQEKDKHRIVLEEKKILRQQKQELLLQFEKQNSELKQKLSDLDNQIQEKITQVSDTKSQIQGLTVRIEHCKQNRRVVLEQQNKNRLLVMYKDLLVSLLKSVTEPKIVTMESMINNIIQKLDDKLSVRLEYENEFELYLIKNDVSHVYKSLGGFEKFVTNLALKIALGNVSSVSKPKFIWIDEHWGSADVEHRIGFEDFLDCLSNWYESCFIISHLSEIQDILEDNRLTIYKTDDGSYVNNNGCEREHIVKKKVGSIVKQKVNTKDIQVSELQTQQKLKTKTKTKTSDKINITQNQQRTSTSSSSNSFTDEELNSFLISLKK
jgi:DNA repair exonuclease SbcCD nuclease subunit/DNA repair exonuclease SbcCD ATPase subunit